MRKRYDILIADEQERDGVKKTFWNKAGTLFIDGDKVSGVIPPGMSISGRWIAREPKPRDNSAMLGMKQKEYEPDPTMF
jgi:hypothetical protein